MYHSTATPGHGGHDPGSRSRDGSLLPWAGALLAAALVVVAVVFLFGQRDDPGTDDLPVFPDGEAALDLRAEAFQEACASIECSSRPVYFAQNTSPDMRERIEEFLLDVVYLYPDEIRQLDGGPLFEVGFVDQTERPDVVSVTVSIDRGNGDWRAQPWLFRWQDGRWVTTTPEEVDVTVTTAVS